MLSSKQPGNQPLKDFQPLGNGISFYRPPPPPSPTVPHDSSPTLIILATWFGALPRHVSKYTSTYTTLFPSASILILPTSIADMIYRPYLKQQKTLAATALPILLELADREVLLHVFSTSGAHTICQLARAYRSHTGSGLRVGALILDSAPGRNSFRSGTDGFISGLPSTPVVRELLAGVVYGLVGLITLKEAVTGEENSIVRLRRDLNDQGLLWSERGRVYFYSKGDRIVGWEGVESHASEAEGMGVRGVDLQLREGSGHVGHMVKNGKRYWDVVRALWGDERMVKSRL